VEETSLTSKGNVNERLIENGDSGSDELACVKWDENERDSILRGYPHERGK